MPENPRGKAENKGFWEGGTTSHGKNTEASGRRSSFPGSRKPARRGIKTDLEFPPEPDRPTEK
jgi:hypothetical protein